MSFTPTLTTDFYKTTHQEQYNPDITTLVSYFTPRMSRVTDKKLVMFGLQHFIKSFLMGDFEEKFFKLPKKEAVNKYSRMMKFTMGERFSDATRWEKLHDLGYLPLTICALKEGTRVPMKVPMIEIYNTHPDFVWLVNYIETAMSCALWHTMASANVGYRYREIVDEWYDMTVENDVPHHTAIGDFSMRGQESIESAAKSSAAFLLSFSKTATIPAIEFLEEYYNCDIEKELVATGLASTEHSVMCSNFAIDGDEKTMVKRLLTEIYPNDNFSMVSDSYDYWNMVTNIMADPEIKEAVLAHPGFIAIRPDSGDPADIICGKLAEDSDLFKDPFIGKKMSGMAYWTPESMLMPEVKGSIECLWDIYGGYVNSKGYKVLNDHIRVVYGDSITPERAVDIYSRLAMKGFAANNVILGMGSYSLQSCEGNTPMTRDTYSIAVKSTYCEVDKIPYEIFKDPKTDSGNFKKSQKGCCVVYRDYDGELYYEDGKTFKEVRLDRDNLMNVVFQNGNIVETSLKEIRDELHGGKF